jgi:hypothetical protein
MGLNELIESIGSAVLDTGGCVSAAEACRLACDAVVIPMVLGSDSTPLESGASSAWPPLPCATRWPNVTKDVVFQDATAYPVIVTPTTSNRGLTGMKQNSTICAYYAKRTMSSCTDKNGTSESTHVGTPNLSLRRLWTPKTTTAQSPRAVSHRARRSVLTCLGHASG